MSSSPALSVDTLITALNSVALSTPHCALSSDGYLFHLALCFPRSHSAPSSAPSVSWHKNAEDLIAISQQVFQLFRHYKPPRPSSSVMERDRKDGSSWTSRKLTPTDEQPIVKKEDALKQKKCVQWTPKIETGKPRVSSMNGVYNSDQHSTSHSVVFSKSVTFMRGSNQLCTTCNRVLTLREYSVSNVFREYNRAFICLECAEIRDLSIVTSSKRSCLSCGRVPLPQHAPCGRVCPTCNRATFNSHTWCQFNYSILW